MEGIIKTDKGCPFCGHEYISVQPWHTPEGDDPHFLECANDKCLVTPQLTGETFEEAILKWNTRVNIE